MEVCVRTVARELYSADLGIYLTLDVQSLAQQVWMNMNPNIQ